MITGVFAGLLSPTYLYVLPFASKLADTAVEQHVYCPPLLITQLLVEV